MTRRFNIWKMDDDNPAEPWVAAIVTERYMLRLVGERREIPYRVIQPNSMRRFATHGEAVATTFDFVDLWYPR